MAPDEVAWCAASAGRCRTTSAPACYWRWPWPIDDVTRVQPDRVVTVEIGFRSTPADRRPPGGCAWSSPHGDDGVCAMPDEAVMITGDGNLVEIAGDGALHHQRPATYLFDVGDPAGVVRDAAESVLRELSAGKTFADLLTRDREAFQPRSAGRGCEQRCDAYGPRGWACGWRACRCTTCIRRRRWWRPITR